MEINPNMTLGNRNYYPIFRVEELRHGKVKEFTHGAQLLMGGTEQEPIPRSSTLLQSPLGVQDLGLVWQLVCFWPESTHYTISSLFQLLDSPFCFPFSSLPSLFSDLPCPLCPHPDRVAKTQ